MTDPLPDRKDLPHADADGIDQPTHSWGHDLDIEPESSKSQSPDSLLPDRSPATAPISQTVAPPLRMVETAFLASTASLIWYVNYYFPIGPILRIFFPVPISLVSLRWGDRAAWMSALVSGLLLSVLLGPSRSLLYVMPFGLLGVLLGWLWKRGASWSVTITLGTIVGSFGFFFRIWLLSLMLGEDLWVYMLNQIKEVGEWGFTKLGWLSVPSLFVIQLLAIGIVLLNNIIYLFAVHLVSWLLLERLGNPIPPPPGWVQVLMDYDQD